MKDIFIPKLHPKLRQNDILGKHHSTITYGAKSLKTLGPKIWNQLPGDIKSDTSYNSSGNWDYLVQFPNPTVKTKIIP